MRLPLLVLTLAALGAAPAAADRGHTHRKPVAPVSLQAVAERGPGGWQVVIDAVPTRDVAVELEVAGRVTRLAGKARRAQRLVVPVDVAAGTGKDVVVAARAGGRSTAVTVRVGTPAVQAPKPRVTVRVVNGVTIREVR